MSAKRFRAKLATDERGRVRVTLPFDPHVAWGKRARHHVAGTLAGTAFDTSIAARNGVFFFPVGKELQRAGDVAPGDEVEVVLDAAEAKREALPADLDVALAGSRTARDFFDNLTPFGKKQWIAWITSAKREATRAARVRAALDGLAAGKKLPRG